MKLPLLGELPSKKYRQCHDCGTAIQINPRRNDYDLHAVLREPRNARSIGGFRIPARVEKKYLCEDCS